jgi:DNA integrity scanning protein DisA with diadenylate cyclase activity
MRLEESDRLRFFLFCAKDQNIDPQDAPKDYIFINKPDSIPSRAVAGYGEIPQEKKNYWYSEFLREKYAYFCEKRKGTSQSVILQNLHISAESIEKYKEICDLWDEQEEAERIVYLLRIYQVEQITINKTFYNTFDEFNEWVNLIIKTDLPECFSEMHSHFDSLIDEASFDYQKVNNTILEITQTILKRNVSSAINIIKIFIETIKEKFLCDICDFLKIDNTVLRIYATSYEERVNKIDKVYFQERLNDSEHYDYGEGISGAIHFGSEKIKNFHVGTNCLEHDGRQSPWHTTAYSKYYKNELKDFWVFPLYENSKLIAAFRVINKIDGEPWLYKERLHLIFLAKWFQDFMQICNKDTQDIVRQPAISSVPYKYNITEKIFEDCFPEGDKESWIKEDEFERVIEHLTKIVHRKIEKKKVGCCLIVCNSQDINHLCQKSGLKDYIIFDNNSQTIVNYNSSENPLNSVAENYSMILPTSGAFVWDETLNFKGVKGLNNITLERGTSLNNDLDVITKTYSNSFAFLLERGKNSILIYHNGSLKYEYYLSDYDGSWKTRSYASLLEVIKKALNINKVNNIASTIIDKVFDIIWWLSYKKIGTMIVVTDSGKDNEKINKMKRMAEHGRYINQPIDDLLPNMIYDLAMVDGAILMDFEGTVHWGGLKFTYQNELSQELDAELKNKGTRHSQAGHIATGENDTLVFTVSENRGITVFYESNIIFIDK